MHEGTQNPTSIADELRASQRHIIKRPRLTKLLDEADARVILLVAPAGYGKTTLAREWLGQRGRTGLWLQARYLHDLRGTVRELLTVMEEGGLATGRPS
jgi:replication-associated recombination protein RarA